MRKKIIIIIVCLLLSAVFTFLISKGANQKYIDASRTVTVWVADEFIPMGVAIEEGNLKDIDVPENTVNKMEIVSDKDMLLGKTLLTHGFPGNPVFKNQINPVSGETKEGHRRIGISVSQASSDQVVSGDRVDLYAVLANRGPETVNSESLVEDVYVVASYTQSGQVIAPFGKDGINIAQSRVPAMVEVEVPGDKAGLVVAFAAQKQVYLVRR